MATFKYKSVILSINYMAIDRTENFKNYKGLWVAMEEDEVTVVASDKTAKGVLGKSRKKGLNDPMLFKVPTEVIPQIGAA